MKATLDYLLTANQINPARRLYMINTINQEMTQSDGKFLMLEVGSWAGESTLLWEEELSRAERDHLILCIDPWELYGEIIDKSWPKNSIRSLMRTAIEKGKILPLFLQNVEKHQANIKYIRGKSQDVIPLLRDSRWNMVYIDGSHYYKDVMADLANSIRIVKPGGLICGDDLELQVPELNNNVDLNRVRESGGDTPDEYATIPAHLGVTVAVWDTFHAVIPCWEGFWAVRKT